jgi:hypothetical protein
VVSIAEHTFDRLLRLVEALPEEELLDAERTEWYVLLRWKRRRALWECIADDSYRHYHQHAEDIRAWREK